jgi:hypothetical protein
MNTNAYKSFWKTPCENEKSALIENAKLISSKRARGKDKIQSRWGARVDFHSDRHGIKMISVIMMYFISNTFDSRKSEKFTVFIIEKCCSLCQFLFHVNSSYRFSYTCNKLRVGVGKYIFLQSHYNFLENLFSFGIFQFSMKKITSVCMTRLLGLT